MSKYFKDKGSPVFEAISGVVLAGGKSSRYGKNKALVELDGIPLIERVVRVMGSIFKHLVLITNSPDEYAHLELPMYGDLIAGLGPVGGVYTALTVIPDDTAFFVACDMPFLNGELIRHMVDIKDDFDVIVPRISGKMEALHAIYRKTCLPAVKRLIDRREYQVFRFFPEVSVRYVEDDEIRDWDPNLRSFLNVNRPQELEMFQET